MTASGLYGQARVGLASEIQPANCAVMEGMEIAWTDSGISYSISEPSWF